MKQSFKESVDDYLQTCATLNKEPDKKFKGSFNVRLSTELHTRAAVLAAKKKSH